VQIFRNNNFTELNIKYLNYYFTLQALILNLFM